MASVGPVVPRSIGLPARKSEIERLAVLSRRISRIASLNCSGET
jgi:hypothetical protein